MIKLIYELPIFMSVYFEEKQMSLNELKLKIKTKLKKKKKNPQKYLY